MTKGFDYELLNYEHNYELLSPIQLHLPGRRRVIARAAAGIEVLADTLGNKDEAAMHRWAFSTVVSPAKLGESINVGLAQGKCQPSNLIIEDCQ